LRVARAISSIVNQYSAQQKPPAVWHKITSDLLVPEPDVSVEAVKQLLLAQKETADLLAYLTAMPDTEEPPPLVYQQLDEQDMLRDERELFAQHPWSLYNTPQKQKALLMSELRRMQTLYGEEEIRRKFSHYMPLVEHCAHCEKTATHVDGLLSLGFCDQQCLQQYYDRHDVTIEHCCCV
jgi:hypothetical protein